MKRLKLKSLVVVLLSFYFYTPSVNAQSYKNAIGLRAGGYSGITYKQFVSSKNAFEIYGLVRFYKYSNFTNVTGVYQIHNDIPNVSNLKWYYGFGATVGFYGYKSSYFGNKIDGASLGVLGTIGLDLALKEAPIDFALDWSPTFFLTNNTGFYGDYAHFSIRYILGR